MVFIPSATRNWQSRPTKPIGLWPWLLIVLLVGALVLHAFRHPNDRWWPVWIHGNIAGKARIIDGDTIDIAGSRIRPHGIDTPESAQTCTDAGNSIWPCGQAATRELIDLIAGRPLNCETSGHDRYHRCSRSVPCRTAPISMPGWCSGVGRWLIIRAPMGRRKPRPMPPSAGSGRAASCRPGSGGTGISIGGIFTFLQNELEFHQ